MVIRTSKAKVPASTTPAKKEAAPVYLTIPPPRDPEAAYLHFLQEAEAVKNIIPMRADPFMALGNVEVAFASLGPHLTEAQEALPKLSIPWILEIADLTRATIFASGLNIAGKSSGEIATRVGKMWSYREPLLLNARSLGLLKLLPYDRVEAIMKGTGAPDGAQDLSQLVSLYRKHAAAIENKHPFSAEWLAEAVTEATWVLSAIRRTDASERPKGEKEAARLRDQFWTLVVERHNKLRTVARVVFEDRAEEMVPALQSRRWAGGGGVGGADDGGEPEPTPEG